MEKVYFRGLNAVRAWAAMFVIWWHIEEYKGHFGITDGQRENWFFLERFGMGSNDAVLVFFVLSGFLITYLLLLEWQADGRINIPKFYLRRSLRIWPVYYLVVLLGFVLVPLFVKVMDYSGFYTSVSNNFLPKFLLFFFFLPNVAHALQIFPITLMHLWTIGVEEAFYVFWPQLVQHFRKYLLAVIGIIVVYRLAVLQLFDMFVGSEDTEVQGFQLVLMILTKYPFEGMAIGALGAYLLFHQYEGILRLIYHPVSKALILILLVLNIVHFRLLLLSETFGIFTQVVLACLYAAFLLNLVHDKRFLPFLDAPVFDFLGKLSYGIYMYHMFLVYFTLIIFEKIGFVQDSFFYNIVIYSVVTGGTIGVSWLSYRFFEMPFLNLKKRFQTIESVTTSAEVKA